MVELSSLTLTLLVARVAANHIEPSVAADELTVLTNTFDAGTNLHSPPLPDPVVQ